MRGSAVAPLSRPQRLQCLCIDRTINLAAEEVKVTATKDNKVLRVGKKIPPHEPMGESIGIEKIGHRNDKFQILSSGDYVSQGDHTRLRRLFPITPRAQEHDFLGVSDERNDDI